MPLLYLLLFLCGASLGSFANVLIYRLPRGKQFVSGRSHCPYCQHILLWYDLIPIISYLMLRGRCRNCKEQITWSYLAVELFSGIVFTYAVLQASEPLNGIFIFFLAEIFLILFMTDSKYLILPDPIILAGISGVLLYGLLEKFTDLINPLPTQSILSVEHFLAALVLAGFFFAVWFFSRGTWLGFGDVKLAILIGLAFGWVGMGIIVYSALIIGCLVGLVLLGLKKASLKTKLPLGAFLSLTSVAYIFWGYVIIKKVTFLDVITRIMK